MSREKTGNGREFREQKENPEIFIQLYYSWKRKIAKSVFAFFSKEKSKPFF